MIRDSSTMQRIREEVWPFHEKIETCSLLAVVAAGQASRELYVLALKLLYGIVVPFENELQRFVLSLPSGSTLLKIVAIPWTRSHLIERDLVILGSSESEIANLPLFSQLTECSTTEQALAILYLLQGSRLGGKVIASNVKSSLGLDERTGCSYFSSNGSDIGHIWGLYKRYIETYLDIKSEKLVIESVINNLSIIEEWFKWDSVQ